MKKSVLMVLLSLASLCAQDAGAQAQGAATKSTKTAKKTSAPAPKATSSVATTVPKNAEALGNGKYRAVDARGEAWIYQETPFGLTKTSEAASKAQAAEVSAFGTAKTAPTVTSAKGAQTSPFGAAMTDDPAGKSAGNGTPSGVTAFPNGNEIRFEKQSPFGKSVWTRKRSDPLSQLEKEALADAEKTTATNGKN